MTTWNFYVFDEVLDFTVLWMRGKRRKDVIWDTGQFSFDDFMESKVKWTPEQGGYQPVQYSRFRSGIFYII